MDSIEKLIADINDFIAKHGLTERQFLMKALNTHHTLRRLREGYSIRTSTIDKIYQYMEKEARNQG